MRQARQQERGEHYLWTWTRWSLPEEFLQSVGETVSFQNLISRMSCYADTNPLPQTSSCREVGKVLGERSESFKHLRRVPALHGLNQLIVEGLVGEENRPFGFH